jgi:hypothetical protein
MKHNALILLEFFLHCCRIKSYLRRSAGFQTVEAAMLTLESFLIWLGGVVFGLAVGFFAQLILREAKAETEQEALTPGSETKSEEAERNYIAPPFL